MKARPSVRFPTKEEILRELQLDQPSKDFQTYVLVVEHRKVAKNWGLYLQNLYQVVRQYSEVK